MKKTLIVFILLVFQLTFSQKNELGKVSIEELKETSHPTDSSAVAAILFNKGKSYFVYNQEKGFSLITEVETKIKIYKKDGLDWGNKEVPFYIGDSEKEKVDFSKAFTYNLVNGAIEKTKLKSEGEFNEVTNKYWGKKKVVMPNVKEGSIIEYKYTITSPFYGRFPDWYFQQSIPVNYSEFTTQIPEYFHYNVYRNGWIFPKEVKSAQDKTITLTSREANPHYTTEIKYHRNNVNYIENRVTYSLENLPALKEESFVNNVANYAAKVQHELSQTRFPNTPYESFSITWEDVAKTIYKSENFGGELKKTGYFEDDLTKLLASTNSNEGKIKAIYEFVKEKVKWDNYQGIYCDKGVRKAYQTGTGNVAEINLMLVAMLRFAGFEANPVLVSTRANGISFFPSRTAYNYVIAAVENDSKIYLYDATNKYGSQNILPLRAINWMGRMIKKDGESMLVDLLSKDVSNEQVYVMCSIEEDGSVKGKVKEQKSGYQAFLFRDHNNDLSDEIYQEKLEKKRKGIEIDELLVSNKTDIYNPIVETYSFTSNRLVETIGNKMYFSPMLFRLQSENPFILEKRNYPIEFDYKFKDSYNISINIPEGYTVESLPASINLAMDKNYGTFKFNISSVANKIQLACSIELNSEIIPMQDYSLLKDFFKEIINKQSEKIILKKI